MRRISPALFVVSALMLSACNPTTMGIAASPLFVKTKHVNLLNASYAAADVLSVQTAQTIKKDTPLLVEDFTEIEHKSKHLDETKRVVVRNTRLGLLMHDQVRSRFQQLGYNVVTENPQAKITGVYEVIGNDLAVRLRAIDIKSGAQLSQYDYWMPITSDLRKYMDPAGETGIPVYKVRETVDGLIVP